MTGSRPVIISTWKHGEASNAAGWPILCRPGGSALDAVELTVAAHVVEGAGDLLQHHDFTWGEPGVRFPRRAATSDPVGRDIRSMPHGGEFPTLAELFSEETNPGRKKPFDRFQ